MNAKPKFKETELYAPVKILFESWGYQVRSEVKDCDLIGIKEHQVVAAELKLGMSLKLLTQAVERQKAIEQVYVAVPRPASGSRKAVGTKEWRALEHLLKRLDLGLILVALDSPAKWAQLVFHPKSVETKLRRRKKAIIKEAENRSGDYNQGGSSKRKLVTAYREKAIEVACLAAAKGEITFSFLRETGFEERDLNVIKTNPYSWFERKARGIYRLSETGEAALQSPLPEFAPVVAYYKTKYQLKG